MTATSNSTNPGEPADGADGVDTGTTAHASNSVDVVDGVRTETVSADGIRLEVRRWEPARRRRTTPTLMLHGVPDDARTWDGLGPLLSSDRLAVAPDLPGLGASEMRGPYDSATVARAIAALAVSVTEGLPGDGRVDVVGHDWGGVIALAVASARPDLVRRLVIVNAPYRYVNFVRAAHIPFFALPLAPELAFRVGGASLGRTMVRAVWKGPTPPPRTLLDAAGGYAQPARTSAMLGYYRAAARHRRASRIGDVAVERALVVWGVKDTVLTMTVAAAVLRDLKVATPDARQVSIPGVGHWPHLEAPEATLGAIAEFLRAE